MGLKPSSSARALTDQRSSAVHGRVLDHHAGGPPPHRRHLGPHQRLHPGEADIHPVGLTLRPSFPQKTSPSYLAESEEEEDGRGLGQTGHDDEEVLR